jgi:hypothetical protein
VSSQLELDAVAQDLDWLEPQPVFVGGATIELFVDSFGRRQLRPTDDVDCIVTQIVSKTKWFALEEELRKQGWSPDLRGPICRYRSPSGRLVDLLPEDPSIIGFAGMWFKDAVENAQSAQLVTGRSILVPSAELLFACKLEAWHDRGKVDPLMSQDLEDLASLLDGCLELEMRVSSAPEHLRGWIAGECRELLSNRSYREVLLANLPRGGDLRAREAKVLALVERLARQPR